MFNVADYNWDGILDLMSYNSKDNKFYIFYNTLESAKPGSHLCMDSDVVIKKAH